jgi:hypothetical protein
MGPLIPGETVYGMHWIGRWVDPKTDLGDVEKRKILTLPGPELRTPVRPSRSQSLYRLFNYNTLKRTATVNKLPYTFK